MKRPKIPAKLERKVLMEAGYRCAIPRCLYNRVEIAHIVPYSEVKKHEFENLIALCPNCHDLYDKDKKIDRKAMRIFKSNLGLVNNRYSDFEKRILQNFLRNPSSKTIEIQGPSELIVYCLVLDGLISKTGNDSGIVSNGIATWEEYLLTEEGEKLIRDWDKSQLT